MHRLLWTLVEIAADETPGRIDLIEVFIHRDNSLTFSSRGQSMAVEQVSDTSVPTPMISFTRLPRAMRENPLFVHPDRISPVVVNALSAWLRVESHRDGKVYRQAFAAGEPTTPVIEESRSGSDSGTTITFLPDPEIFDATTWSLPLLQERLGTAASEAGVRIRLTDERTADWTEEYGPPT